MIKSLLIGVFIGTSCWLIGQEVVATKGGTFSNANANLDFTIGETVVFMGGDNGVTLNQGFHQSNWSFLELNKLESNYEVEVYPNPTVNALVIKTKLFEGVSYFLYDMQGKLILSGKLTFSQVPIEVGHLSPGSYMLILKNNIQPLKTLKIVKHN